jgi:hypothetical protein
MKERRTKQRHSTEEIQVSSPTIQGQVLNLSMDGLAIETATALRPGKRVSLKIDGEGSTVTGQVKWSKLRSLRPGKDGDSEAIYHAGIAIERNDTSEPEKH